MRERKLDVRELQYFLSLARDLHCTGSLPSSLTRRPALMSAIAVLEQELRLLPVGNDRNKAAPQHPDSALTDVPPETASRVDTLRIARTASVSRAAMDRLRLQSLQEDPGTRLNMYELPLPHQLRGLHGNLLDVGLSMSPFSDSTLRCIPLWHGQMVATVPVQHSLAQAQRLALK